MRSARMVLGGGRRWIFRGRTGARATSSELVSCAAASRRGKDASGCPGWGSAPPCRAMEQRGTRWAFSEGGYAGQAGAQATRA